MLNKSNMLINALPCELQSEDCRFHSSLSYFPDTKNLILLLNACRGVFLHQLGYWFDRHVTGKRWKHVRCSAGRKLNKAEWMGDLLHRRGFSPLQPRPQSQEQATGWELHTASVYQKDRAHYAQWEQIRQDAAGSAHKLLPDWPLHLKDKIWRV